MREFEAIEIVKVEHVPTALNRADMLTKAVDVETFVRQARGRGSSAWWSPHSIA